MPEQFYSPIIINPDAPPGSLRKSAPPAQTQTPEGHQPPAMLQISAGQSTSPPPIVPVAPSVSEPPKFDENFSPCNLFVTPPSASVAPPVPVSVSLSAPAPMTLQPTTYNSNFQRNPSLPVGLAMQAQPPAQPQVIRTAQGGGKAGSIKASDVEKELMAQVIIHIVREALYVFDGRIYRFLTAERMHRVIRQHCRGAVEAVGNASIIKQVFELLCTEPNIAFEKLDDEKNFIAFANGLLALHTGQLIQHTPDFFVTALVCGNLLPELAGKCPVFQQFLAQVSGGDLLLQQRIWEIIGYCLSPDTAGKCFFLLQGVPDSGKSLLGDFISSCFEEEAVTSLDLSAMGLQFGPSELLGKRLCLSMDLAATPWDSKAVGVMKGLTGNDLVSADVKYRARVRFRNTAKLLFGTNHAISTTHQDDAFFRRMIVVPFRFSVPKAQQDRALSAKFQLEKNAIISTAMGAYLALRQRNYVFAGDFQPNEVLAAGGSIGVVNPDQAVAEFFHRFCELNPDASSFNDDLHLLFQQKMGLSISPKVFSAKLCDFLNANHTGFVTKERLRKHAKANPQSSFKGLKIKEGVIS